MAGGWGNKIMQDEPSFIVPERFPSTQRGRHLVYATYCVSSGLPVPVNGGADVGQERWARAGARVWAARSKARAEKPEESHIQAEPKQVASGNELSGQASADSVHGFEEQQTGGAGSGYFCGAQGHGVRASTAVVIKVVSFREVLRVEGYVARSDA
ncbi:hypothetical protein B0T26DRAFT_797960 [Lasiosphaeria miniovina]|uniref:Uncharacterized protein n=1 Tax=Lasiosphaeria miniovina TaxID=1954250 RepID=A0AA40BGX9_9PEZI|nr:uncharacterized protein B0T26DRAFT_797960 [Lasiosphaeria miniovina]KAK0734042.1 hypothetical protein B0T26DRAFT_797960 [Lasiosphaeria miniovina]